MMIDEQYIKKCLELACKGKGYTSPNPLVGCIVVKEGKIIAEGYHHKFGEKHAEIDALDKLKKGEAKGATLYVNLEPCSFVGKTEACTDRIIKEGVDKVVFGMHDPNPKVEGAEVLLKANVEIVENVLKDECSKLNQIFSKWIKTGLPYVTLKIAQTSDHFVAYPDGSCPHITNKESRTKVHELRAWYDAVLIGKGTVESDDPALTIRHTDGPQPWRVVLDSQAELISSSKKLLTDEYAKKTIWVINEDVKFENPHNIEVIKCVSAGNKIFIKNLLEKLAEKNISSILVEGGPQIWQSFLEKDLADQILLFTSEKKFTNGIPALPGKPISDYTKEKAEEENFGLDILETIYLKLY